MIEMNDNTIIQPYNPGERERVLRLYRLAHKDRELPSNYYRWRYEENPFGPPMIDLMFEGKKLIGHYAVCPTVGNIDGIDYPIVLSMNTFTHPDYWGKGIFTRLAKNLYQRILKDYGVLSIYGFPNTNSHYNFIKRLSWNDVFLVPTVSRDTNIDRKERELKLDSTGSADVRFDDLWNRIKKDRKYIFANARTSNFISWRFTRCPTNKYTILTVGSSSSIEGYAIVKKYMDESKPELDLVDFLIEDNLDGMAFLQEILEYAAIGNYERVNAWIPLGHRIYNCAEKLRFIPQLPITYLSYRLFREMPNAHILSQPAKWYLTMADSDVY